MRIRQIFGIILALLAMLSGAAATPLLLNTTAQSHKYDAGHATIASANHTDNTYYVAPGGDDSNPGAFAEPWKTVAYGISQLQAGDTLYLRGGVYYETVDVEAQGTASQPITVKNYPGETAIIDGGYQDFRIAPNTDWEVHDAARDIYRSVNTYAAQGTVHAYLASGDDYYHLVPYERYPDLSSDNQVYKRLSDSPNDIYVGPGLFWDSDDERIYIRLTPSDQELAMGYNIPANPNPGQNVIYMVPPGDVVDFKAGAAYLAFEGVNARFRNNAYHFQTGSHHITLTKATVLGGRTHIMIDDAVHHLVLDALTIDDSLPPWIARSDVKEETKPAHSLQQSGINLQDYVHHVEISHSTFNNMFDAIDADGEVYNIRLHHNAFYGIRDDVLQLGSASYNIEVDHNRMIHVAKGPGRHGSGSSSQPGTKYIHHNVLDLTKRWLHFRVGHPHYAEAGEGMIWGTAFGSHTGNGFGAGDPWQIYNNTILIGAARNANFNPKGVGHNYTLGAIPGLPQEVYNNIFIQTEAHRIARGARVYDGSQILDGNLYYRAQSAAPPEYLFRHWENETTTASFNSLAAFKSHPFFTESQAYYPPGWENAGVEADPQLDSDYYPSPSGPAANGAIDLSGKGWPGADGSPYRGALAPPAGADFTGSPTAGEAPLSVSFTDQSSHSPTGWHWTFGDGGSSSLQNPSHSYDTPGVYTVTLTASHAAGSDTLTQTDYISVSAPNDPPVANNDSANTPEETLVTINVAANDTDPEGNLDPTSANTTCANGSTACAGPANGTLVNNSDGTFDYTPNPSFSGHDSFVYQICDTGPLCDTATVSITAAAATATVEVRVAAGSDDAEERATGSVALSSSDLELVFDKGGHQMVGMRFNSLTIPQGATIHKAYVQFQVDETHSGATSLTIAGEATDQAPTFTTANGNISSRSRTTASTAWSPAPWTTVGEAGPDQQTPDIAPVVQEIVSRPGWSSGNALVIIITGSGERTAEAYDGVQAGAPLLHVEYNKAAQ